MYVIKHSQQRTDLDFISQLEQRLEHGDRIIRQLEAAGKPTGSHVQYWLKLLEEYEQAYQSDLEAA